MRKKLTFKDFFLELSYYQGKDDYEKWISFLEELGIYADYNWDIPQMQYNLVKSDEEWKEFTSHPERQPFMIAVKEWHSWDLEQVYRRTLLVLSLSINLYKNKATPKSTREQIKLSLSQIMKGIVHSRYDKFMMEIQDSYVGITPKMRSGADLHVTDIHRATFDFNTAVAAFELNMNVNEVRRILLDACQDDLARLSEFLLTCQFTDEFKNVFVAYRKATTSDHTLTDFRLRFAFKVWRELFEHGLDLNTYLDLLGYPDSKTVKKRLLDVVNSKEIIAEVHQHLKNEMPLSYQKLKKNGSVAQMDIMQEQATLLDYPKSLRTEKQTEEMIQRSRNILNEYFPISAEESPRQLIFNATHPFAVKRAFQSQTQNSNKQVVNVMVLTPTSDSENDYLETFAHETTHAIHSIILNRGAEFGVITQQQAQQVPTGVLEDFSQLVEGQFKNASQKNPKNVPGKYFASFNQATGSVWQAPFGLIQLELRELFEEMIREGVTEIPPSAIVELRNIYIKKVNKWWNDIIGMSQPASEPFNWIAPLAPYDGLVYMKRFILPQKVSKKSGEKEGLSMNSALTKRFGEKWIDQQDARILLYWLLLETGRNHATEVYGELILKKDIRECLEELQKIGIAATEFSQRK